MGQKVQKINAEEQLLQARQRGLEEAQQIESMKAHGKVLGMDTFSWVDPQVDALAAVIDNFPFPVFWVTNHVQARQLFDTYPEAIENVRGLIIYDNPNMEIDPVLLSTVENVLCVTETNDALLLLTGMHTDKNVFLFTTSGTEARNHKDAFKQFVQLKK